MKVGIFLGSNYTPHSGGGYSYIETYIKEIDEYNFSSDLEVLFIESKISNEKRKRTIDLNVIYKSNLKYRMVNILRKIYKFFLGDQSKLYSILVSILDSISSSYFQEEGIDVIYYPEHAICPFPNFPHITTSWDLGHLTSSSFPEFSYGKSFTARHEWYTKDIFKSLYVFVESNAGKEELIKYTGMNSKKIKIIPIFPSTFPDTSTDEQNKFLERTGIKKDKYLFYPAQFWPHKNHINLIKAFKKYLSESNSGLKLVFTGSDKGNLENINNLIEILGIQSSVINLGFVSKKEIKTLYTNAQALVMPTFLGPTNMPLLEARDLKCPVICSDFDGHKEQLGEGALYFNPADYYSIVECIKKIEDEMVRKTLIDSAFKNSSKFNVLEAVRSLESHLLEIEKIRQCW